MVEREQTRVIHIRVPESIYQIIAKEAKRLRLPLGTVAGAFLAINVTNGTQLKLTANDDDSGADSESP